MRHAVRVLRMSVYLLVAVFVAGCDGFVTYKVKTETRVLKSTTDILPLRDSLVKPVLYKNITGLQDLPLSEGKQKFISAILPSILVAKHQVENERRKLLYLTQKDHWNKEDSVFFFEMKNRYGGRNPEELSQRIITMPNSIILAQAAIETGWGQSRFFIQASNLFGIWSFDDREARIEAGTRNNTKIFLRSYENTSQSITDYFQVLSRHRAYRTLRKARRTTNDPFVLVDHLKHYSERRNWYVRQLKQVIRQNNLTRYDQYRIDPQYLH